MSQAVAGAAPGSASPEQAQQVNDIVIRIATPNGSGSQSANNILMRSIFTMGIPVNSKNLFPSNIQGLPTWFTIRANENGWQSARNRTDLCIAMNPQTAAEDIAELHPGAMLIVREALKHLVTRDDLTVFIVPFNKIVNTVCEETRLRKMVINMIYVGVVAYLLGIEMEEVDRAVAWQFSKKAKAAELNTRAALAGYEYAIENLPRQNAFALKRSDRANGKILIEGNQAAALGMVFGGITVAAWYPITPSSSVCEYLTGFLDKYRRDENGKNTFAVVQAEDELAALGMVLGAGWAGARAFTATSGPGLSLMAEMAGLSYFAEIPAVVVDVQRMGPSTGLPTRTCQGDVAKAYALSHGDCKHILLIPGSVRECYEFAIAALDLAEKFQTMVFLMSDLDLGMNKWMSDAFDPPSTPMDRGKVLNAEALSRNGAFARYRDVDGDGIPYRTVPGTDHPNAGFFTRGTGHTETAGYSEKADVWQRNIDRLTRKFDTARDAVPAPAVQHVDGAKFAFIAYGSSDAAVEEARHLLEHEHGVTTAYLRIRALPASNAVKAFCETYPTVLVVEQNRDAQVAGILRAEFPDVAPKFKSILHYNGLPIDADSVVQQTLSHAAIKETR
ncbi:MAG: 2-oxoacid:acceptor oxidoreductase subunit alpha [Candidatus Hydrogenedentes bacterium]|nr:2-oxoacid:acceptor oxidoreductase subunit alpha [Candidatus Hydrogenedentota bacterium]